MEYLVWVLVFVLGAAVGSFVNVVVDRYNTGLPWWKGKSFCFSCNTTLRIHDLLPVFSFVFLKGKCRYCQSKIPRGALWIELLMGALALLAFGKTGIEWDFLFILVLFAIILLISVYDLRHFIIPDAFLIILLVFALFHIWFNWLPMNLLAGILLPLPFLILFLISRGRWMGLGDVKYIAILGFLLGPANGVSAVFAAFWIGAIAAIFAMYVFTKLNLSRKSEIPFGPFLSLGAIISLYFDMDILQINALLSSI